MTTKNLCDSCCFEFITCGAQHVIFAIDPAPFVDRAPAIGGGVETDRVIECKTYIETLATDKEPT